MCFYFHKLKKRRRKKAGNKKKKKKIYPSQKLACYIFRFRLCQGNITNKSGSWKCNGLTWQLTRLIYYEFPPELFQRVAQRALPEPV